MSIFYDGLTILLHNLLLGGYIIQARMKIKAVII